MCRQTEVVRFEINRLKMEFQNSLRFRPNFRFDQMDFTQEM